MLLAIALTLVLLGVGAFVYLFSGSPLSLLSGSDRPIAAATTLIPARSPFTISLLTRPERLIDLQQALADAEQRQSARDEIDQLEQTLLAATGLDYERDLLPWMGEEVTFAYTDADLDGDRANGQQPGSMLLIEIAPDRLTQAQQFLQTFWQQRSLAGDVPKAQKLSGVRVLFSKAQGERAATSLTSATALVGSQFVIFANDVRVLQQSIRAAQIGQSLAQNAGYRQRADQLLKDRIALAYFEPAVITASKLKEDSSAKDAIDPKRVAVSFGLTRSGLVANTFMSPPSQDRPRANTRNPQMNDSSVLSTSLLRYLPADSQLAFASHGLSELPFALVDAGFSLNALPDFLRLGETTPVGVSSLWNWAREGYAIAQLGSNNRDWIAVVNHDSVGIDRLDGAAIAQGYSSVPIAIGERQATAWTRLKASNRRRSSRRSSGRSATSGLETELLGLHLQQDTYEIFAGSLLAMESALAAAQYPLAQTPRFERAIAPLPKSDEGFVYLDWPAIAPSLSQNLPVFNLIHIAAQPLLAHVDTLALTRNDSTVSAFIQLSESPRR